MILSAKKVVAISVVVSLLGVAATFGLKELSFKGIISPVEAETIYGPIRLTATLDKSTFRLGEKINVTVTITNISNETIMLSYSSPPKTDFAAFNSLSQTIFIYSQTHGFMGMLVSIVLEPLESYSQTLEWDQLEVDNFPPFASRQVQSGTYYITGRTGPGLYYLGSKDEYQDEFEKRITVETPKIEIQIR